MKLTKIFVGIAALLLAGSALNAATVSYSGNATVGPAFSNINIQKFDTSLGTLTGVSLTIYSVAEGSFRIVNNDASDIVVSTPISALTVNATGGGGMSQYVSGNLTLITDPSTGGVGYPISPSTEKIFTINPGQIISNYIVLSIDSGSWSNYQGVGTVTFQAKDSTKASVDGGDNSTYYSSSKGNTTLTLTYTYDTGPVPVPEASTVIVQLLIVAGGVWMFVRRRRAAAVRA